MPKSITFAFEDEAEFAAVVAVLCANHGYQPRVNKPNSDEQIDNPVSPIEFAVGCIRRFIGDNMRQAALREVEKIRDAQMAAMEQRLALIDQGVSVAVA